jgi:hypothetical protein
MRFQPTASLAPRAAEPRAVRFRQKKMKFTQYFLYTKQRPDRAKIKMEWIEKTIKDPDYTEVQSDKRIRKWKKIKEEGKFLRVILLPDGETVHNAFFDRSFKGEEK